MGALLRPVGLDFLDTAPERMAFSGEVPWPREDVFAAFSADPSTWRGWFPGCTGGAYEGPGPHGVGARRRVHVGGVRYLETILAWDTASWWVYRVDESTAPLAHALVEGWSFEDRAAGTSVRWTFAIDPRPAFAAVRPLAPTVMGALFGRALRNLTRVLTTPPARSARRPAAESAPVTRSPR
jgi:hypothetical protein